MNPNKGPISRDSFSTCQEVDIFVFIRHQKMTPSAPLKDLRELDTLDSENEALKRLVENRPVYYIVKSGKFFLMAFLMPLHIFLYRLPKWAIVKMIPKMVQAGHKINTFLKENFDKIIQAISKQIQVISALTKILNPLSAIIKSSFQKLAENFILPFKKTANTVSEFSSKINNKLNLFFEGVLHILQNSFKAAKTDKPVFAKNPLKKIFSGINTQTNIAFKKIEDSFKKISKKITDPLKKALAFSQTVQKAVTEKLKPVADAIKEKIKRTIDALNQVKQKITEYVSPKLEMLQVQLEKTVQIFKPPVVLALAFVHQINERAMQLFMNTTGFSLLKGHFAKMKSITVKVQSVQMAILRSFKRLGLEALTGLKKFKKTGERFFSKGREKAHQFINKLKSKLLQTAKFLKGGFHYFSRFLKKAIKFILLTLKWCRIMSRFTVYLIGEIFREIQVAVRA